MDHVHQLKVFMAVADTLSFTRAAERLLLTQSAVSHQIAKLERDLGCQLLKRQGRSVSVTPAGQALMQQSPRVFSTLEEVMLAAQQAARPGLGRLRIGASSAACQYILPDALRAFREHFPDYSLSIMPGDSPVMIERLLAGTIDLDLMIRAERQQKLVFHELFSDDLRLMVSPQHPWAKAGKADRGQIAEQKMVLYNRHSITSRMVDRYFVKMRAPLRDWIELGDFGAIKELVKSDMGVSVAAEWIARREVKEGSLVLLPLPGGQLKRTWCIASVAGKSLSPAEKTFIRLCQSAATRLNQGA